MKDLIDVCQELHFQLYGKYIESFQESNAQIIAAHVQEFGKIVSRSEWDREVNEDMRCQLECHPDKIFMSSQQKRKYKNKRR